MSPENPDAVSPPPPPRTFSLRTLIGVVCFGVGLLIVASGVLLAVRWMLTADILAIVLGLLLILLGVATNATGLVLIYRSVTRAVPGARNGDANP